MNTTEAMIDEEKKMTAEATIDEEKQQDTHLKKLNINKDAETGDREIKMNIKVSDNIKNILIRLENNRKGDNASEKMAKKPGGDIASGERRGNEDIQNLKTQNNTVSKIIQRYERKKECKLSKNLPVHETKHHAGNDEEPTTSREILKISNIMNYDTEAKRKKEDERYEEGRVMQDNGSEVKEETKYQIMRDKIFNENNKNNNNYDDKKKEKVKERRDVTTRK